MTPVDGFDELSSLSCSPAGEPVTLLPDEDDCDEPSAEVGTDAGLELEVDELVGNAVAVFLAGDVLLLVDTAVGCWALLVVVVVRVTGGGVVEVVVVVGGGAGGDVVVEEVVVVVEDAPGRQSAVSPATTVYACAAQG